MYLCIFDSFTLRMYSCIAQRRQWQPTPVFLPGESQGWGSLVDCRLWGHTKLDMTEAPQQQQQQHVLHACMLSYVQLFATLWTVAHQAPLSMGILQARKLEWVPCPPPRDLPDPGIEPESPALAGRFFTTSTTWEAYTKKTYRRLVLLLLLSHFSRVRLCAIP